MQISMSENYVYQVAMRYYKTDSNKGGLVIFIIGLYLFTNLV